MSSDVDIVDLENELKEAAALSVVSTFALAIVNGELDDHLGAIVEAVSSRRDFIRMRAMVENKTSLNVGDVVRLKGLRPAVLNGLLGKVQRVPPGKFVYVRLLTGRGRFEVDTEHGIPYSCVEKQR